MLARTNVHTYHVGCRQRHRSGWYARYSTYHRDGRLRARGDLYSDRGLVREGFDVAVSGDPLAFAVDIGTGSGVKLTMVHDPVANEV